MSTASPASKAKTTTSTKASPEAKDEHRPKPSGLPASVPTSLKIEQIPLDQIVEDGENRRMLDLEKDPATQELAANIATSGLLQPICVQKHRVPGGPEQAMYRLVYGHRRLAAMHLLNWSTAPCTVLAQDAAIAEDARAAENLQRLDLNVIEASLVVGDLIEREITRIREEAQFPDDVEPDAVQAGEMRQRAIQAVCVRLGKPESWIRDRLFLSTLDKTTRELTIDGRLPWKYARMLAQVADPAKRAEFAKRAASGPHIQFPMEERDLRRLIAEQVTSLAGAPWKLEAEFGGAPACTVCPSNSANQRGLFEVDGNKGVPVERYTVAKEPAVGVCLNRACYGRKSATANRQISTASKFVTATISAAKKPEKDAAKKQAIAEAPTKAPVVPEAMLKRAIEERRSTYEQAAKNKGHSSGPAESTSGKLKKSETPEKKAERDHETALHHWRNEFPLELQEHITKKLAPLPLALFSAFATSVRLEGKGRVSTKDAIACIKAILKADQSVPALDQIVRLAGGKAFSNGAYVEWWDIDSELYEHIAEAFGVKPNKPKPVLEDFLPKSSAQAAAKTKPAKKPRGKKGAVQS